RQGSEGFSTVKTLSPEPTSANSGEKPQSKPWSYDGKWWAVFPNSSGTHLWRLDGTSWTNVLRLSSNTTSKADCKVVGNITHILLYQGPSSQMVSVEYESASGTYELWSKRTSTVGLTLDQGVETATIDVDGNGRMWLASAGVSDIKVRWSDAPYHTWSSPITVASGVKDDDICAVIALPGKIGVFWSNQTTRRFGFKTHTDGADPSQWSADEVPASQSALNIGSGMADDHMNFAVAHDGTLYCAVKTSYNTTGYPLVALLIRRPAGNWDQLYEVSQTGTRPIVIFNEALGKLKVVYSSAEGGGNILYRESSNTDISFGAQRTLLAGTYNNATSTKANYTSDIVILASNSTHVVGVLANDAAVQEPVEEYTLAVNTVGSGTVSRNPS
ncbi:T9SS type A sorting domain-containing protein, partial [Pontibacter sp. HJ8]